MKKGLLLLASLFLLAGCALPLPLKVASWALDGISYVATDKSIAENGLSIIAKKDCSLMRPLRGQPVCIGNNYDIAQVLKNAVASAGVDDQSVQVQETQETQKAPKVQEAMAGFETAAGPPPGNLSYDPSEFSDAWRFMRQQAANTEQTAPEQPALVRMKALKAVIPPTVAISVPGGPPGYDAGENAAAWAFIQARNGGPADTIIEAAAEKPMVKVGAKAEVRVMAEAGKKPAVTPAPTTDPQAGPDAQPSAGLYYVIGSLTKLINIDRLSQRQSNLESLVVVAQLRDRPIYREVVGPFKRSEKQAIRRMIEKAGVTKAWLTFIDPHRWTLASPAEISALKAPVSAQTASLR